MPKGNADIEDYIVPSNGIILKNIPTDERIMIIENEYCLSFGCGRILSLSEKRFGKHCINHQNKRPFTFYRNY